MKNYELLFIVKPTLTEEEIKSVNETVKGYLTKEEANIAAIDDMGMKNLAYEIKKHKRGHYFVIYFTVATGAIKEITRLLRFNEEILKFMIIKYENKSDIANWERLVADVNKNNTNQETK
jgi:small subunit ribosomal protein S6